MRKKPKKPKKDKRKMPNFTGIMMYPMRANTIFLYQVTVEKPTTPQGLDRGHVTEDYNVVLRGTQKRIDTKTPS